MDTYEIAIIYFSCGCAAAAHHYFKSNRTDRTSFAARLSSTAVSIFWPVYLLNYVLVSTNFSSVRSRFEIDRYSDSKHSAQIALSRKLIESLLVAQDDAVTLFELRDTLARYSGLSSAASEPAGPKQFHLLELNGNGSLETQHICLYRRNRQRLIRHRNQARTEFIDSVALLMKTAEDSEKAGDAALEFVKLLGDDEAANRIENVVESLRQKQRAAPVNQLENQTWVPQEQ